ncbi:Ig-like domain repeat protein [Paenibacillus hamazuiensis]|uniref:Ig-like domain repeat protein n=1 Tax=Paenibacillus hamazuiensis TaxID=2936508 RepID=UPI00200DB241|nr:immunoglobulin-like domain-containing protein [Paenibacillus hamazuiensis]
MRKIFALAILLTLLGSCFTADKPVRAATSLQLLSMTSNITSYPSGRGFKAGDDLYIYAKFNMELDWDDGPPSLWLVTLPENQLIYVPAVDGYGKDTLTFKYVVTPDTINGELELHAWNDTNFWGNGNGIPFDPGPSANLDAWLNLHNYHIDTVKPKLIGMASSTGDYAYKSGQAINLQLQFSENVYVDSGQLPSLTLNNGATAAYSSGSGTNTLQFTYTVQPNEDVADLDISGVTHPEYIRDAAYNTSDITLPAEGVQAFKDKKDIRIDTQGPEIAIASAAPAAGCPKDRVQITSSDAGIGLSGIYYKWDASDGEPAWSGVTDMVPSGAFLCAPAGSDINGMYYLHARAVDTIGNETTKAASFLLDNTPPAIQLSAEGGAARHIHTVRVTASDELSGLDTLDYSWGDADAIDGATGKPKVVSGGTISSGSDVTTPAAEGSYVLSVTARDKAGNAITRNSQSRFIVDTTPPKVTLSYSGIDQPARTHLVEVTLEDAKGTLGPAYYGWSERADLQPTDWTLFYDGTGEPTKMISTPANVSGTYYLFIKATDNPAYPAESNVGYTVDAQAGFMLDNTPPESFFSPSGSGGAPARSFTVELRTPGDTASMKYIVTQQADLTGTETGWVTTSDGVINLADFTGTYYVHAIVTDDAGNSYTAHSGAFLLDNQGPVGTASIAGEYTNQENVQVVLFAEDTSQVTGAAVKIDDQLWSEWQSFTGNGALNAIIPKTDGVHTIYVKFKDSLGNESAEVPATVTYDETPPTVASLAQTPTGWTNGPVRVTVQLQDNQTPSGQIKIIGQTGPVVMFDRNGTYTLDIEDLAGNRNSFSVTVNNIDKTLPEFGFTVNGSTQPAQSANTVVYAKDDHTSDEDLKLYIRWSQDGEHEPAEDLWLPIGNGETAQLSAVDGYWYLWVKAADQAGNERVGHSSYFALDNTPPSGSIRYSTTNRTAGPVTAMLEIAGNVTVTSPADGSREHTFTENGSFTFEFRDEAGNRGTTTAVVDFIDASVPSAQVTLEPNTWTSGPVKVTVSVAGNPPRGLFNLTATGDAELLSLIAEDGSSVSGSVYRAAGSATVAGSVYGAGSGRVTESVYSLDTPIIKQAVYRFNTNGELKYFIRDLDTGIENGGSALVNRIDKTAPKGKLVYSTKNPTNSDVTVKLVAEDDASNVTILNNGGSDTVVFTENGSFTFRFRDEAGNTAELTASVDTIDKDPPHSVLTYSETSWTNRDVTATLTFDNETRPVTIIGSGGSNQHTFTANGSYTFFYRDAAGNEGQATALVDWIDREPPTARLTYSTVNWTNRDVTVTLSGADNSGEPVRILNNEGSTQHTFTSNGQFQFEIADAAGNRNTVTAVVNRIDKVAPTAQIQYSATGPTNAKVRATLLASEPVTVVNNGGEPVHDFEDNGEFSFILKDYAGNESTVKAKVDNIDRTPPIPGLAYSTKEQTKDQVIVTVTANEPVLVLNNGRKNQYVFTDNGRFTFTIRDLAGNMAEIEAVVGNIDKSKPKVTLAYSTTEPTRDDVTVAVQSDRPLTILNNNGSNQFVFKANGVQWLEAKDNLNNLISERIEVSNIDREAPIMEFAGGEMLLLRVGDQVNPGADVKAADAIDGDVTANVTVQHQVNTSQEGEYDMTYMVTDRAGNKASIVRKARVIGGGSGLNVFVNGSGPNKDEVIVYGRTVKLDLFGVQGDVTAKWAYGKKTIGDFKTVDRFVENGSLTADRSGYYTILVQDQERQKKLFYVYMFVQP